MKLYYDVMECVQHYLVTRDPANLVKAKALLSSEQAEPELQESILTLDNISVRQVEMTIAKEGYLRIDVNEVTNTEGIPVLQDKYIRIVDKTAEFENNVLVSTAIVLKVAAITDDYLLLVPYTPGHFNEGNNENNGA